MDVTTITSQEFKNICEQADSLNLIDVRTPAEFREVHLRNARNLPLDQLDPASVEKISNGNGDSLTYVICQGGARGERACLKLMQAGINNVVNVAGGTKACVDIGMDVQRGKKTISLERQVRIAAGALVLLGAILGFFVNPYFIGVSAFVGAGLVFAGVTDTCGMAMMLARMPWNQVSEKVGGVG